jgi:hypothetical protein
MADQFNIRYKASVIPVEELEASDTNLKKSVIHSLIDKSFSGGADKNYGTTGNKVVHYDFNLNTIFQSLTSYHAEFPDNSTFLFITINSTSTGSTPDCSISFDTGSSTLVKLEGVGDFCLLPLNDISCASIQMKTTEAASTKVSVVSSDSSSGGGG